MRRLRLRTEVLDKHRAAAGITSQNSLAAYLGINQATVSRVLARKAEPGPAFIAALAAAFPCASLDDLLEVVHDDTQERASA